MKSRKAYQKTARKIGRWIKYQKYSKIAIWTSIIITLIMSSIIVIRYKKTQTWAQGALNGRQSQVPPEFARNIYSVSAASDMKKLANVSWALDQIDKDGGVNDQNYQKINDIFENSAMIIRKYHVSGGDSFDNQEHLKLYLDIYHFLNSAYSKPDAKEVNRLSGELVSYSLSKDTQTNKKLLKELKNVANDYNKLSNFSNDAFKILGSYNNEVVKINSNLTKTKVNKLLSLSNNQTLMKFKNVKHLREILNSQALSDVLDINKSNAKKEKWEKTLAIYNSLAASQYISVKKIKTLKDVLKYHLKIQPVTIPDNARLLTSSKVIKLYYHKTALDDDQYIKISSDISAQINPDFKEIEQKEQHAKDQQSSSDDTHDNSDKQDSEQSSDQTSDNHQDSVDNHQIRQNNRENKQNQDKDNNKKQDKQSDEQKQSSDDTQKQTTDDSDNQDDSTHDNQ